MTALKELFKKSSKAAAGMTIIGVSAAAVTLTALTAPGVTGMKPYAAETTATENGWSADGMYWYENGVKQGTEGRGKEIYDPETDAWYWLDAVQNGAKAVNKDVYQESWAGQYADREDGTGKWVRYDENGHMVKGWTGNADGKYYFDTETGAMAKGITTIDGVKYRFDEATGTLLQTAENGEQFSNHVHSYSLHQNQEATCTKEGVKVYVCDCGDQYTVKIPATGHSWKNEGPIRMDWQYAGGPDDAGHTNTYAYVSDVILCGTCNYYLGADANEEIFAERYWKHFFEDAVEENGSYTVVPVYAVFDLLECTECGRYKRGDFAFYEYWPDSDEKNRVELNEAQIKELGLVPGQDKEY